MPLLFLMIASSFLAFFLFYLICCYIVRDQAAVKARIANYFNDRDENLFAYKTKKGGRQGEKGTFIGKSILKNLSDELSLSGIKLKADEFIVIWALSASLPAGLSQLAGADRMISVALFACGILLPYSFVKRARTSRMAQFEIQLSDALMIIGNCLRTGLSFEQAVGSIARDMPEPISKEFARLSREVRLGLTMENALENMVGRVKSRDLMLIIAAVLIQRQVGGNLSEILDGISDTIRERLKIKTSIKVLTASGRTSGMVVGLMPVFIMFVLMLINPSYIRMFFDTTVGITMLCIAGFLEAIGFLCVKKIVSIKF